MYGGIPASVNRISTLQLRSYLVASAAGGNDRTNFWLPVGPVPLPKQDEEEGEGAEVMGWVREAAAAAVAGAAKL